MSPFHDSQSVLRVFAYQSSLRTRLFLETNVFGLCGSVESRLNGGRCPDCRQPIVRVVGHRSIPVMRVMKDRSEAEWFRAFRHALVPGDGAVAEDYRRTIDRTERDASDGIGELAPKGQRHVARLEQDRDYFLFARTRPLTRP